ncbi:MAG: hypothetical protein ACRCXZ_05945, partial [Patescibacteria group bacterium]
MNKEKKIILIGFATVLVLALLVGGYAFVQGFISKPNNEAKTSLNEQKNERLRQPIEVSPIPPKKTELRVDFTKESYN